MTPGRAVEDRPHLSGGSDIALGLSGVYLAAKLLAGSASAWVGQDGPANILPGSCSTASLGQLAEHTSTDPAREVSADAAMAGKVSTDFSADWAMAQDGLPSIYTAAHSAEVHAARERYGRDTVGTTIEALFAATARGFVASALAG